MWIAPTPGCISLIIIEFAIQEPPALPTSPVLTSTATIENVEYSIEKNNDISDM